MIVAHDPRAVVRARGALNDARSHIASASTRTRQTRDGRVVDVLRGLDAVETALEQAWDTLAYVDAELAAYLGGD